MPYTFLDHTTDVRMHVQGQSLRELFADAVMGMSRVVRESNSRNSRPASRRISVESPDLTALLIDFLNEVLLLMHTQHEVYTGIRFARLSPNDLEADLTGYRVDSFAEDIKAVTWHEADVVEDERGIWQTNLIFDI